MFAYGVAATLSGLVTPEPVVGTWGGDPALPGPDGALIMGVRRGFPEDTDRVLQALTSATPTIVMGAPMSDSAIVDLRRAGAKQVLARDCSPSDLVQAVQSLRRVRPSVRRQPTGPTEPTARELEVTTLLAQGLSNREIAGALFISEHTVRNHLGHVFSKLGVSSRTQAVVRAGQLGWLRLPV
ncbi:MAG: response regulator transcription factor [Candidatus Nanopelagicales bacterium]